MYYIIADQEHIGFLPDGAVKVLVTIVVAIVYCIYLGKIKEDVKKNEN
ncbi:hypothetical protein [Butyrivibrio sp. ob235]|nr:hypothetical protein [Butyrivibrio sp. ob235]